MKIIHTTVVGSVNIVDGAILNADVNAAAGIEYTKLDSAAIDVNLIPDGDHTRALGSGAMRWDGCYLYSVYMNYFMQTFSPWADGTLDIGDATHNLANIFVNSIQGNARDFIMLSGMMGGNI